jgi:hypothetical protein
VLLAVARIATSLYQSPAVPSDDAEPADQAAPLQRFCSEEDARAILKDAVAFAGNDISSVSPWKISQEGLLTCVAQSDPVWRIYLDWELGLFAALPEGER